VPGHLPEVNIAVKTASPEIFFSIEHGLVIKKPGINPPVILQLYFSS
jgi:hypothetical protein